MDSEDDISWMIEYLVDGVGHDGSQRVPMFDGGDTDKPNCNATGVYIEWDHHDGHQWIATGLSGPLKGKSFKCSFTTFTEAKWNAVDAIHSYGIPYRDTFRHHIRQAAFHYVENHCVQLLARLSV